MASAQDTLLNQVLSLPLIVEIKQDETIKRAAAIAAIPSVINEVLTSYTWPFMIGTSSTTSVANQSQYVLEGANQDARDIINVKYDSDLLQERNPVDMDEWLDERTLSDIEFWQTDGVVNGFPRIKIMATPDTAGDTIDYRYIKNNLDLEDVPDEFDFVLSRGIASYLHPSYYGVYEKAIKKMIDHFSVSGGGERVAQLDRHLIWLNNRRVNKMGWGG